ncbi:uncharacterized protein LOC123213779 isoform X4 [Mangifera indica]|uniref:uncharacterized protein LOC123213779 isoform X4 n=1 Tax=Mangifera indica TaxID=29780 RepID=UPI001CFB89F3|nr:uncharacterized protein LOC123213779 isoform X4 [Mangifera indica]
MSGPLDRLARPLETGFSVLYANNTLDVRNTLMDSDDELFAGESGPAVKHGRGRFQPRAKPRPSKGTILAVASSIPSNTEEKTIIEASLSLDTTQILQPADNRWTKPSISKVKEPLKSNGDSLSQDPIMDDNLKSQVVNPSSEAVARRDDVCSGDVLPMKVETLAKQTSIYTDTEHLVQPIDVTNRDYRMTDPVGLSLAAVEIGGSEEQLKGNDGFGNAIHSEVTVSVGCGDLHSSFEKPAGDLFVGFKCVTNYLSPSTNEMEKPAIGDLENVDGGENGGIQGRSCFSASEASEFDASQAEICADLFMVQDPVTCRETCISKCDVVVSVEDGRMETEVQQSRASSDLETDFISGATVASGWHAGKFKPKPKLRAGKENSNISMTNADAVDSVMQPPTVQYVSSESQYVSEGSFSVFPPDHMFDYTSVDLGYIIPPQESMDSEFPMNEELTNLAETYHADNTTLGDVQTEDVCGMTENQSSVGRERKVSTASNLSQRSNESSLVGGEYKGGKSSKNRKKRVATPQLVDEPDDETHDGFTADPLSSNVDEDVGIGEHRVESKAQKKRAPRKSKKPVTENGKPVRRGKKSNEASDQSTKEPPKKFSHSTRRNRRRVSKELLETPEDEIDPRKVPMKDLILLAEYRERLAVESKEAKTSTRSSTNQSTENPCDEDTHSGEETFASEQGIGYTGNQATRRVQSSLHFNYQSFMKKTPTVRWPKQDTELFYEAIGQFGTDLTMIQQLFPGRTRQQIKLKFKKEERKQPLKLNEALTNRSKDHSHFEKLIEQLREIAAQARQDSNGEEPIDIPGEEEVEELATEINDEAEKVKQDEDGEADVAAVGSPLKSDDEDDIFSSYNSVF